MPDNRILKKGEMLFYQGETPEKLYLLQSGEIEILSTPEEFVGLHKNTVVDKGTRVCSIKGKAMLLGFSGLLVSKYSKSARAIADSEITEYPLGHEGFKSNVQSDINGSLNMLRQIFNNFMLSHTQLAKSQSLLGRLNQIDDNLSLIYHNLSSSGGPEFLNKKSDDLYFIFSFNKGKLPEIITADFLLEDMSSMLKKSYSGKSIDDVMDKGYAEIIKRILKLDLQIISAMVRSDPGIALYMFSSIASAIDKILNIVQETMEKIDQKAKVLFNNSDSWAAYFSKMNGIKTWNASGRLSNDFFSNMSKINVKLDSLYVDLSGKRLNSFGGYGELLEILDISSTSKNENIESNDTFEVRQEVSSANVISTGLQKSIFQIFEFSMVDKEFQNKLLKLLNDYKNMMNVSVAENDARKMRRFIAQLYWELYQQVFVRSKIQSSMPKAVKLMLNFGFLDDRLVYPEHLIELNDLARIRERETEMSILLETEFLSNIYSGVEEPSITEMGLTYEAFLKEQEKTSKKGKEDGGKEDAHDSNDANLKKTLHEIMQRLKTSAAVCSGSTVTAFPILTLDSIKGSLKDMYVTKSKLNSVAKKLLGVDYSLFYRETVLRMGEAREVIYEEILPYLVLLPITGTKTLLWQELSGNNKRSKGRFMVPILFSGDLERALAHTFACFRWELTKNAKGAMWADPIEGGVTGEYFDYVNTFKKNPKFTPEMKEKINLKFKSLRTNRDRFADDYLLWIEYEKDGIMKLNTVVREMFYKHVPFARETRDRLENMPAFSSLATRYKNIKAREYATLERKFKKYQDGSGSYPKEIQSFFNFLKM